MTNAKHRIYKVQLLLYKAMNSAEESAKATIVECLNQIRYALSLYDEAHLCGDEEIELSNTMMKDFYSYLNKHEKRWNEVYNSVFAQKLKG